jgi:threonine/homoserine/homoserine lactone efflux protein
MPAITTLLVFATVALAFAAVPGPSNLYVLTRGIGHGPRPAMAGAVGCATGAVVYVVATALGLSAILASSVTVLALIHYLGAAYLVYMGIRALRSPAQAAPQTDGPAAGPTRLWPSYRQGLFVELSNPKVALFFLALLPQFVHAGHGPAALQLFVLGMVLVVVGLASDLTYAMGSGRVGEWMRRRPRAARRQGQLTGVLYLGLGAWAALSGADARKG